MNAHSTTQEDDSARVLLDDLKSLEVELARERDLYLRLAADFDNFRKRSAQETDRRAAAQKEAFIQEMLSIMDNLERVVSNSGGSWPKQLHEGVCMTLHQLHQLLGRHGIEPEESRGQVFDPHRHEAVATRHDPSQPDHIVLEVCQRGYRRGNEVFRPSKVVVNDLSQPKE